MENLKIRAKKFKEFSKLNPRMIEFIKELEEKYGDNFIFFLAGNDGAFFGTTYPYLLLIGSTLNYSTSFNVVANVWNYQTISSNLNDSAIPYTFSFEMYIVSYTVAMPSDIAIMLTTATNISNSGSTTIGGVGFPSSIGSSTSTIAVRDSGYIAEGSSSITAITNTCTPFVFAGTGDTYKKTITIQELVKGDIKIGIENTWFNAPNPVNKAALIASPNRYIVITMRHTSLSTLFVANFNIVKPPF
jgi:hypothetical protein